MEESDLMEKIFGGQRRVQASPKTPSEMIHSQLAEWFPGAMFHERHSPDGPDYTYWFCHLGCFVWYRADFAQVAVTNMFHDNTNKLAASVEYADPDFFDLLRERIREGFGTVAVYRTALEAEILAAEQSQRSVCSLGRREE